MISTQLRKTNCQVRHGVYECRIKDQVAEGAAVANVIVGTTLRSTIVHAWACWMISVLWSFASFRSKSFRPQHRPRVAFRVSFFFLTSLLSVWLRSFRIVPPPPRFAHATPCHVYRRLRKVLKFIEMVIIATSDGVV